MIASLWLVLFFLLLSKPAKSDDHNATAGRVIFFTKVYKNVLLDSEPYKAFHMAKTRTYCAMLCLIEPNCKSYSFCEEISCLLYSNDSYTLSHFALRPKPHCFYVEMAQNEHPSCKIGEEYVNITSDEGQKSKLCAINNKRADGLWTEWISEVLVDTSKLYKTERKRECLHFSHGGFNCTGLRQEVIIFPLTQETRFYYSAKRYCAEQFAGSTLLINALIDYS